MKKIYIYLLLSCIMGMFAMNVKSQILNPADPIVIYNPTTGAPAQPAYGTIGKWIITRDITNWNTDVFKAYIYKGMAFRLMYPKSYVPGVSDGKSYPLIIMFHGDGEGGPITDNDLQLFHGGQNEANAEASGQIDAFVLHAQSPTGWFITPAQFAPFSELITYMVANTKVDPYRVAIHGLSAGGSGAWTFLNSYPKLVSASAIMSYANQSFLSNINQYKYTPMWYSQGGQDQSPPPSAGNLLVNSIKATGASLRYLYFPNDGHDTWDDTYADPQFFPFLTTCNKLNPMVLFQKYGFCQGVTVNAQLGITPGFDAYQWSKNGVVIPGATSNAISVTDSGSYAVRVQNGSTTWSYWSPVPAHIYIQPIVAGPTPIQAKNQSNVFPGLDTSKSVALTAPGTFLHYAWTMGTSSTVVDTNAVFQAKQPGSYQVMVTLPNGCLSLPSASFTVYSAAGSTPPPAASNVLGFALSQTSIQLNWSQNPAPTFNETGFEVYRGVAPGGPYVFAGITKADSTSFVDKGILANTTYYYVIRAVNNGGAAPKSAEISVKTQVDSQAPTAPTNLAITSTSATSLGISWTKATDNVGVYQYYIYLDGVKTYVVDSTVNSFTIGSLSANHNYMITVKAVDLTKNISPASNTVSGYALNKGFNYSYYVYPSTVTTYPKLPDLNTLTPVKTGNSSNINIGLATQATNFLFKWTGTIYIPTTGSYTIGTSSDDGSNLYIDVPYSATTTPTASNDGLHGTTSVGKKLTLTKGAHTITVTYYQEGGGSAMQLWWSNTPITGITSSTQVPIADSYFIQANPNPTTAPTVTNGLTAATDSRLGYKLVNLSWTKNTDTSAIGYEITRSKGVTGPYVTIASITGTSKVTFADSVGLSPSTQYYYQIRTIGKWGQSAYTPVAGLLTQYYVTGTLSKLPDFNTLTPTSTTVTPVVDISKATQTTNFAYKWTGTITIPVSGNYTFGTSSDDGSKLYINTPYSFNATALVNNDALQGTTSKEGTINLAKGSYPITITYFQQGGGAVMSAYWRNTASGVKAITPLPASVFGQGAFATTSALPAVPSVPVNVAATALNNTTVQLSFTDATTVAVSYQIYRAVSPTTTQYTLITTLPAGTAHSFSYTDNNLFPGSTYYYKVAAVNVGGSSAYSNIVTVTPPIAAPVLTKLANVSMRYGTTQKFNITSKDPQGLKVTLSGVNLPAFATISDFGDGTGLLTLAPAQADQGTYNNVLVKSSNSAASSTDTLSINVNGFYTPVIDTIPSQTLTVGNDLHVALNTTDPTSSSVTYSSTALPSFVTIVTSGPLAGYLDVNPQTTDKGTYSITVTATDLNGLSSSRTFVLTVNAVPTSQMVYINFNGAANSNAPAPWNNTTASPAINSTFPALLNATGQTTAIGFKVTSDWAAVSGLGLGSPGADFGQSTGNNSGVYPDNVELSSWWTDTRVQTIQFYGLQAGHVYNFTLLGSSQFGTTTDRQTQYTIGTASKVLNAYKNTSTTTQLNGIQANSDGTLNLSVSGASSVGGQYGFLNALVLTDSQIAAPVLAAVTPVSVQFGTTKTVNIAATDPQGLKITLSATNLPSYATFVDNGNGTGILTLTPLSTDQGNATVTVTAANSGASSSSQVAINVNNFSQPVIASIPATTVTGGTDVHIALSATDASTSAVTFSTSTLPSYVKLVQTGPLAAYLDVNPQPTDSGTFNISIIATDANSQTTTTQLALTVSLAQQASQLVYINFNGASNTNAPAPWNNTTSSPAMNANYPSLKNSNSVATAIGFKVTTDWAAISGLGLGSPAGDFGVTTNNNSGVYPDNVELSTWWTDVRAQTIQFYGLQAGHSYDFTIYGATQFGSSGDRIGQYTIGSASGSQSVTLNDIVNTTHTVAVTGQTAKADGTITLTVNAATGSQYGYLNAVVLKDTYFTTVPSTPTNLTSTLVQGGVQLNWTLPTPATVSAVGVYRSTAQDTATYTLLNTKLGNIAAVSYIDSSAVAPNTYKYKVQAIGTGGPSGFSGGSVITVPVTTILAFPTNVAAASHSTSSIVLTWKINDANAIGTIIYRSTSLTGTFTKIDSVSGAVATYTNSGLPANTTYYYYVKSKASLAKNNSNPSATATASTLTFVAYVNFNDAASDAAPAPWNNTNTAPLLGTPVLTNLLDANGNGTGIKLTTPRPFFDFFNAGAVTGNNSGIYPDAVIKTWYYQNVNDSSIVELSNLNVTQAYDLVMFSSYMTGAYPGITAFSVGGKTVTLDPSGNSTRTVELDNIVPDENGAIFLTVKAAPGQSYAFLNALVVQGHSVNPNSPTLVGLGTKLSPSGATAKANSVQVFPNPFADHLNLNLYSEKAGQYQISVYNMNGQVVMTEPAQPLNVNYTTRTVNMSQYNIKPGIYIFRLVSDVLPTQSIRVIKH